MAKSPLSGSSTTRPPNTAQQRAPAPEDTSINQAGKATPAPTGWVDSVRLLFRPDFANDGKVVCITNGEAIDFSLEALRSHVYTPQAAQGKNRSALYFVAGANQWFEVDVAREKEHADVLGVPMVGIHNASLVKESQGQTQISKQIKRIKEGIGNVLLQTNLVSESGVKNISAAMADAISQGKPAFFGGESQGSILVGHALIDAKNKYITQHLSANGLERNPRNVSEATTAWEAKAAQYLNVITFGNAYDKYPAGPRYIHVMMKGDPVPNNGSRPDNKPADAKTQYLVFDQLFAGKNNFENHNIAFLMHLLKRTCELNTIESGDLSALFAASQAAFQEGRSLTVARPDQVQWSADMQTKRGTPRIMSSAPWLVTPKRTNANWRKTRWPSTERRV